MRTLLKVGTRGSPLALTQTGQICDQLLREFSGLVLEKTVITTTGDRMQTESGKPQDLTKAIFTKEIEEALLDRRIDIAVHSAKDLGVGMPAGLCLGGVPSRVPVHDVLISRDPLEEVMKRASPFLATGSARRQRQWQERFPQSRFVAVRGNIDTRIRKLRENPEWDGIILAHAGLERLKPEVDGLRVSPIDTALILPAPGQGAIALQCRSDDTDALHYLGHITHRPSLNRLKAERAFVEKMEMGCQAPLGALARIYDGVCLHLAAVCYTDSNPVGIRGRVSGSALQAEELGHKLAGEILAAL